MKFIDLTGERFGRLVVIKRVENKNNRVMWLCKCDCGKYSQVNSYLLRSGKTTSCGCASIERISNLNKGKELRENLTGKRFGRLTVIEFSHKENNKIFWKCKCDCGNETIVRADGLKTGHAKSCGCYNKERVSETKGALQHGLTDTKIYGTWFNIKARCYNPSCEQYRNYGGRGIKMCDEWLEDVSEFAKWSYENGYNENLTIDRIDVNKDYEPSNCRWTTWKEQANNKRNNRYIEYNGEVKTLKEWCELYDLKYNTVKRRIYRGWEIEEAFFGRKN